MVGQFSLSRTEAGDRVERALGLEQEVGALGVQGTPEVVPLGQAAPEGAGAPQNLPSAFSTPSAIVA